MYQRLSTTLLSVTDTRLVLGGIGRTKLYALIKSGDIHPIKLGRRTFFKDSEIAEFIADLASCASSLKLGAAQTEAPAAKLRGR
ncbi:MAG: helix-turn-helix domain-containing protein [Rhodospirillales bacterium]|nr:helix-turn-helix domain-containing protein [Acetobacter sp.]